MPSPIRWVIRDVGTGWYGIHDMGIDGRGPSYQLATAFSRGRAEIVRDALEAAWPLDQGAARPDKPAQVQAKPPFGA